MYINIKQSMGNTNIDSQNLNIKTNGSLKSQKSPATSYSDSLIDEQNNVDFIDPIFVPSFTIRQSPFKVKTQTEEVSVFLKDSQQTYRTQLTKIRQNQQQLQQKQTVNVVLWTYVLYETKLYFCILDFLPCQDTINVSYTNRRLYSQFYFYKLFHRQNNWNYTNYYIENGIQLSQNRQFFKKVTNEPSYEQSQHSLDIDRLQSLFLFDEDVSQQLVRVDRIMRALNNIGQSYFQGLNSIIIVLIGYFQDQIAFWIVLFLLHKSQRIHNDIESYEQLIGKIDNQVKAKCPRIYGKIDKQDLTIEYFAMKWVMNLFSSDLNRSVVLSFWDLLLNFGISVIKWFVVSIFCTLQQQLLKIQDGDQLNKTLKSELKNIVKGRTALKILKRTRRLMCQQMFGSGSSDIFKSWNGYRQQQKLSVHIFTKNVEIYNDNKMIDEVSIQNEGQQQQLQAIQAPKQAICQQSLVQRHEQDEKQQYEPVHSKQDPIKQGEQLLAQCSQIVRLEKEQRDISTYQIKQSTN